MIRFLIQNNYACTLICVYLLIFIFADHSYEKKISKLFSVATFTVLLFSIADSIDYYIAAQPTPMFLRNISSALGYSLRPLSIYCIALIVQRGERKWNLVVSLPLYVNAFVALCSIWTGWMFSFSSSNAFIRGPLGYLSFIVSGFYMLIMMICNIRAFHKNGLAEMMVVIFIGIISVTTTFVESIFGFKFLLNASIGISLMSYYLFLHVQIYKRDMLTNLLNRRNFYQDAAEHEGNTMVVASIDINNLKKINDKYGHEAGDVAIITVVHIIEQVLRPGCSLYRVGGDEFMLLAKKQTVEEVQEMFTRVDQKLKETSYTIATGVTLYEPGMDFQKVCIRVDEIMYEHKKRSKLGREK